MVHSTGAEDQLNRLKPAPFGSVEYASEELLAELGSALIATRYGMEKHLKDDSAAYLKNWLDQLHESPEFLKTTLLDVKKASAMVTGKVDAWHWFHTPEQMALLDGWIRKTYGMFVIVNN